MNSTIIECREKDATPTGSNVNGVWQTILKEPVTISRGDKIAIKSTFIDTEASESQKIAIDDPLELTLNMHHHMIRTVGTGQLSINNGADVSGAVDGQAYIACTQESTNEATELSAGNAIVSVALSGNNLFVQFTNNINTNVFMEVNNLITISGVVTDSGTNPQGRPNGTGRIVNFGFSPGGIVNNKWVEIEGLGSGVNLGPGPNYTNAKAWIERPLPVYSANTIFYKYQYRDAGGPPSPNPIGEYGNCTAKIRYPTTNKVAISISKGANVGATNALTGITALPNGHLVLAFTDDMPAIVSLNDNIYVTGIELTGAGVYGPDGEPNILGQVVTVSYGGNLKEVEISGAGDGVTVGTFDGDNAIIYNLYQVEYKEMDVYLPPANGQSGAGQTNGWYVNMPNMIILPQGGVVPTNANSASWGLTILNPNDLLYKNTLPSSIQVGVGEPINSSSWYFTNPEPLSQHTYTPVTTTFTMLLGKGNYDPNDLCLIINREMQRNVTSAGTNINSKFIISNNASNPATLKLFPAVTNPKIITMISVNGNEAFQINGTIKTPTLAQDVQYIIGASETELAFDPNQQKFQWNYLHTPYYSVTAGGTDPALDKVTGAMYSGWLVLGGSLVEVNRWAGITFSGMSAKNASTGEQVDFWNAILGFNPASIIGTYNVTHATIDGVDVNVTLPPITIGTTCTGGFTGLANAVNLTGANSPWWIITPTSVSLMNSTTVTEPIWGDDNVLNVAFTFGYFLIEVNAQFRNNFLGANQRFAYISQIVSRYFSVNSYTSAESGQIVYTHNGEDMLLSSFKIRILDSSKNVPDTLGDDNTVFIQVDKALPQLQ